ncbi:MAG: hypothetical protein GEU93_03770 [Propionibacteriales bacterium]|nr:hypothetical protein [Propionibacteriales bacterium]
MRFQVRKTDQGYGVWDTAVNELCSGWDLTEAEANEQAHDRDVLYDRFNPRRPEDVRHVTPPKRVDVHKWVTGGALDVWVRENGEWYGRVRDKTGRLSWRHARELRPTHPDEEPSF